MRQPMGHDIEIMLPQSVVLPVSYWAVSVIGKNQFCSEPMDRKVSFPFEVLPWLIGLSIGVTVFIPSIKVGSSDLGESCRVTVDSITSRLVLLIEVCSPVACIAWNCTYGLRQALLGRIFCIANSNVVGLKTLKEELD